MGWQYYIIGYSSFCFFIEFFATKSGEGKKNILNYQCVYAYISFQIPDQTNLTSNNKCIVSIHKHLYHTNPCRLTDSLKSSQSTNT